MKLFLARRRPGQLAALTAVMLAGGTLAAISLDSAFANDKAFDATSKVQKDFKPIPSFAPLVKDVSPAVVSVTVHLKVQQADNTQAQNGMPPGMPFAFPFPFPQPQQPQAVEAKGSGFFISSDGYIVTNNHVVKNAKSVFVTLSDGSKLPAKIVGTDPSTDLAVLKVKRDKPFPYLQLGDSAKVVPGQWVIAIGNPFGLAETVTTGVVSALGRDIGDGQYDSFIQIDAPINEGNSGGPLLNQRGEVIGVIPGELFAAEIPHPGLTRMEVVTTMHERKALMAELADGFAALPGGLGTLDELIEILTWQQIGLHAKPVALVDAGGFWAPLTGLVSALAASGFVPHGTVRSLRVVRDAGEFLRLLT
jgi:uncharacterized protein (TIGR00730 family)